MTEQRVVVFSPVNHKAASPKVVHFANWLSRHGHTVDFLTSDRPDWLGDTGVVFNMWRHAASAGSIRYVCAWIQLFRLVKRRKASLLIVVNDPGAVLGAWIRMCFKLPVAVLAQEHTNMDMSVWKSRVVAWHYRKANLVCDISEQSSAWRRSAMGLRRETTVFLNVPPLQDSSPPPTLGESEHAELALIYTGYVAERSCLREFILGLAESGVKARTRVYGTTEALYLAELRTLADTLGLSDAFFFGGVLPRQELMSVLREGSVGIALCKSEAQGGSPYCCPNKLFEYFSAGLAVLASNQESVRSWVEPEEVGVCVDPLSVDSIAQGIRILADKKRREDMRENALKMHRKEWNMDTAAREIWGKMQEVINPPQ